MTAYYQDNCVTIHHGDCLNVLSTMQDNSVDSIITDPPYGLSNTKPDQVADVLKSWVTGNTEAVPAKRGGFMGKDWDSFVPPPAVWKECLRVLKPGGHMAVFAGARTQDLMGLSIRLAGFEIRDSLAWLYGSGFPKSLNVSKAIDKAAGALAHESVGFTVAGRTDKNLPSPVVKGYTPPAPEAAEWDGWGTALKPAIEPIVLARKPLDGTVANNVLAHGVGGLNIDGCRVPTSDRWSASGVQSAPGSSLQGSVDGSLNVSVSSTHEAGRWPANVLLDEHAAEEMDEQSGVSVSVAGGRSGTHFSAGNEGVPTPDRPRGGHNDSGGASRFFPVFKYQAKAPKRERPVIEREDGTKIQHPTVKPLELMRWLIRLITPPGGTVLDPFAGSGTTIEAAMLEGFYPVGIEMESDYLSLITARITRSKEPAQKVLDLGTDQ